MIEAGAECLLHGQNSRATEPSSRSNSTNIVNRELVVKYCSLSNYSYIDGYEHAVEIYKNLEYDHLKCGDVKLRSPAEKTHLDSFLPFDLEGLSTIND